MLCIARNQGESIILKNGSIENHIKLTRIEHDGFTIQVGKLPLETYVTIRIPGFGDLEFNIYKCTGTAVYFAIRADQEIRISRDSANVSPSR